MVESHMRDPGINESKLDRKISSGPALKERYVRAEKGLT